MPEKAWKVAERRIASMFGTRRNPLSGINSGRTGSDTWHQSLFLDVKHCKERLTQGRIASLLLDVEGKAASEGKIPVIVEVQRGKKGATCWLSSGNLSKLSDGKASFLVGVDAKELSRLVSP